MQDFVNVYARTFMVAARMEPTLVRQYPVPVIRQRWLSRLIDGVQQRA
jgi:hypothetical protein